MIVRDRFVVVFALAVAGCAPQPSYVQPGYPAQPQAGADGEGDDEDEDVGDDDADDLGGADGQGWGAGQPGGVAMAETPSPGGAPATAGAPAAGGAGAGVRSDDCRVQLLPPNPAGGCRLRLVTPAPCETVDLSGGRRYEFAWTTDGSGCETPWTIQVAGNPITPENLRSAQLSTDVERGITRTGGVLYLSSADLDGLRSDNGLYHWSVQSHYGAHPGTHTFTMRR